MHPLQLSDDTQLRGAFNTLEGRAAVQRAFGWREEWANRPYMVQKGQVPSPACGKEEPLAIRQAGDCLPRKQLCQQGPEGSKLSTSEKRALAATTANSIRSCTNKSQASRSGEVVIPF